MTMTMKNGPIYNNPRLEQIIQAIEGEVSASSENASMQPISLAELLKKEFKATRWIVEKLIPADGVTAISGSPGVFKTWIVLHLAIAVAQGLPLFGEFQTSKTGVLIVDEENGERIIRDRAVLLGGLQAEPTLPVFIKSYQSFQLNEKSIAELIDFAKEHGLGIIVFDSLVRIHSQDENDARQMSQVFTLLKELTRRGISVVLIHHNRKPGINKSSAAHNMRGSSDILAAVHSHLAVERKEEEHKLLTIKQTKLRQAEEVKPFQISIVSDKDSVKLEYVGELDEAQGKKEEAREAIQAVLEREQKPMFTEELFTAVKAYGADVGRTTFNAVLKGLVDAGNLAKTRGLKNAAFYTLKLASGSTDTDENSTDIENEMAVG